MKEDKLKKYVEENRSEFDLYSEDYDQLWGNIEQKLDQNPLRPKRNYGFIMKIAATFLVLIVATFFILRKDNSNTGEQSIPEALAEAAFYYQGIINDKLEVIEASKKEIDPDIFSDLEALDSAYLDLQNDLKDNADNQEVVEAMIQNYKIKLEILEAILSELQQNDEEDKDNKEVKNESINI